MATTFTPPRMAGHADPSLNTPGYCERAGLMPRSERLSNGHRRCRKSDVERMEPVRCLRDTGTPIRLIRRRAEPTFTGDETVPERVALRSEYRAGVLAEVAEVRHNLEYRIRKPISCADTFNVGAEELTL